MHGIGSSQGILISKFTSGDCEFVVQPDTRDRSPEQIQITTRGLVLAPRKPFLDKCLA